MKLRGDQLQTLAGSPRSLRRELRDSLRELGVDACIEEESGDLLLPGQFSGQARVRFDNRGLPIHVRTPEGRDYRFELDEVSRYTAVADAAVRVATITYNEGGAPTSVTDAQGFRQEFLYDERQMLRGIRRADGHQSQFHFGSGGELLAATDTTGRAQRFEYDDEDRLVRFTDRTGASTEYKYGEDGKLAGITTPTGAIWQFADDEQGNRSFTFPDGRPVQFLFDGNNLVGLVRPDGQRVTLNSGPGNHVIGVRFPGGGSVSIARDDEGRLLSADNGLHAVAMQYGLEGRLTAEQIDDRRVEYQYRPDGLLDSLRTHRGATWSFAYGPDQRISALSGPQGCRIELERDARGDITAIGFNGRVRLARTYTLSGLLATEDLRTTTLKAGRRYKYDKSDLLERVDDSQFGTITHQYDAEDRLVAVVASQRRVEYEYDGHGNLVRTGQRQFVYNPLDQLVASGSERFTYDSEGNLTEKFTADGVTRYEYNSQNQLARVTLQSGATAEYEYDGIGRRVVRRVGETTTRFTWCGQQLVAEDVEGPSPQAIDYIYLPGTHQLLAMVVNGQPYFYQTDHLGSPVRLISESGRIVWAAEPLGYAFLIQRNEVRQPFRFPGHYCDAETGLHYNVARYYDPATGRYLATDPLWFQHGTNLYRYAANNPVRNTDTTGQALPLLAIAAIVVVAAGVIAAGHSVASDLVNDRKVDWGKAALAGGKTVLAGAIAVGIAAAALPTATTLAGVVAVGAAALAIGALVNTGMAAIDAKAKRKPVGEACEEAAWGVIPFQSQFREDYEKEQREGKLKSATGQRIVDGVTDVLNIGLMFLGIRLAKASMGKAPKAPTESIVWTRQDSFPYRAEGRAPGRVKSHVGPDGSLLPANPEGKATIQDHIRGSEPRKSDSPYTSLKDGSPATGKQYGGQEIKVDVERLKKDVASGKVKDVEVIDHDQLVKKHDEYIEKAQREYSENPSAKNQERLDRAKMDKENSVRDREVLIKGIVPPEYVTVSPAAPASNGPN